MATSLRDLLTAGEPTRAPMLGNDTGYLTPGESAQLDATGGNALTNAFTGARVGSDANALAAQESSLRAAGDPESMARATSLRSRVTDLQAQARAYAAPVGRYEDVHGIGDLGSYVAGQIGQGFGSSVDQVATGSAMGLGATALGLVPHPLAKAASVGLRALAPVEMYRQNANLLKGEAYNEVVNDPVAMQRSAADIDTEVSKHGYRAAIMDTLPQLLPVGQIAGGFGKALGKVPAWGKFAGTAVAEGVTETGQQISQHYAQEALNPNRGTLGDRSENINSFLGGAIGGGGMGAVGHVAEAGRNRLGAKGDGANGDAIPLNSKAPSTEPGIAPPPALAPAPAAPKTLEEHLVAPPDTKDADFVARSDLLNGLPPENLSVDDTEAWMTTTYPERHAAVMEEIAKLPEDAKAQQLRAALEGATDPIDAFDALDAAGKYVAMKSGAMQAAADATERIDVAAAAATKNKRKNNWQTESGPNAALKGEASETRFGGPAKTGGAVNVNPDIGPELPTAKSAPGGAIPDREGSKVLSAEGKDRVERAQTTLARDFLVHKAESNGREGTGDLADNLSQELLAMAGHSTSNKPTSGELARAKRVGRTLSDLMGDDAEWVVGHLAKTFRAESSPSFQAVMDSVRTAREPDAKGREAAATELADLIPPEVQSRLLAKKIDLSRPDVRERMLRNIEDFADGTSDIALDPARRLLGKETFDAMLAHVGTPIQRREGAVTEVGSQEEDTALDDRPLSSDDVGGDMAAMTDGMRSDEEQSAFELAGEEKSQANVPPESMAFHHGTDEGTVRTTGQAWDERKDKNGVLQLPQLLRLDTNTARRKADTDEAYAERTAPGGAERMLKQRLSDLRTKAEASLGQMRDRYIVADTTALALMDRQNLQPSKRAELFFKYAEKEKNPHVANLREAHKAASDLAYMDKAMSDTVVNRQSISPSGEKLSIAEASAINSPRIKLERLRELVSSQDAERIDALIKEERASKSTLNEKTGGYESKGLVKKSIGLARIIRSARKAAELNLNETLALDPAISAYMDKTQAERGALPGFDEVVNNFFGEHHMVTAEQDSNRDHLQMNLTEFRAMETKGETNEKSAWNSVKDLGWAPGDAQTGKMHEARASMNLIRFNSEHSRNKHGDIAVPAYMLVDWVRTMRKAHEKDLVEGGGDVRGKSNGIGRQTEDYKRDLLSGITALMQNGLTEGLPWIVNAKGERESFSPAAVKGKPVVRVADGSRPEGSGYGPIAPRATEQARVSQLVKQLGGDGTLPTRAVAEPSDPSLPAYGVTRHGPGRRGVFAPKAEMAYSEEGKQLGFEETALGALPPSLDLNGITEKKAMFNRAFGAAARRDEAAESESGTFGKTAKSLKEQAVERAKNKELNAEPNDVQDADAIAKAEEETTGSKTRDAQREDIKINSAIERAAADAAPRAMSRGRALNTAARVAESLWRDYSSTKGAAHTRALGRIWAYIQSAARPGFVEGDDSAMTGGEHYGFPLAALLTPRHMAAVAAYHPNDLHAMAQLRSQVAAKLNDMRAPVEGYPRITGGELGRLIDAMSGYNDRRVEAKLDAIEPSDPAQLKEWEAGKAGRLKWGGGARIKADDRPKFLSGLAEDYLAAQAAEVSKTAKEVLLEKAGSEKAANASFPGTNVKPERPNRTPAHAARGLARLNMIDSTIYDRGTRINQDAGKTDASSLADAKEAKKQIEARTPATLIPGAQRTQDENVRGIKTEGKSQDAPHRTTIRERLIERKKKGAAFSADPEVGPKQTIASRLKTAAEQRGAETLGTGRSTDANDRRFLSAETVELRTAETNARNNAATRTVGILADAARATPVVPARETIAKERKPGIERKAGEVNASIAGKPAVARTEAPMAAKPVAKPAAKSKTPALANPPSAPAAYQRVETAKLAGADLILAPTSVEGDYAGKLGRAAREEGKLYNPKAFPDMAGKTLLVSVPGRGRGFTAMPALIQRVFAALDAGAAVRTDIMREATTSFNMPGEGVLRAALIESGYSEKTGPDFSTWSKAPAAEVSDRKNNDQTTAGEWLYHGTRADESALINADGDLVLKPSKNFGGRTTSVSFTKDSEYAADYATRVKGAGPQGRNAVGAKVLKIKSSALKNLTEEAGDEMADNTGRDVIIKKGDFELEHLAGSQTKRVDRSNVDSVQGELEVGAEARYIELVRSLDMADQPKIPLALAKKIVTALRNGAPADGELYIDGRFVGAGEDGYEGLGLEYTITKSPTGGVTVSTDDDQGEWRHHFEGEGNPRYSGEPYRDASYGGYWYPSVVAALNKAIPRGALFVSLQRHPDVRSELMSLSLDKDGALPAVQDKGISDWSEERKEAARGWGGSRLNNDQTTKTAHPFVGILNTEDAYQRWSNTRDGSDRAILVDQMEYAAKNYGGKVTAANREDMRKDLSAQFPKWFKNATAAQQDAALDSLTAKAPAAAPAAPSAEVNNPSAIPTPVDADIFKAKAYIGKTLGPKITALFEKSFPDMTGAADWSNARQMIRIATASPVSIMQRAYHESMHGFFSNILKNHPETREMLERAMSAPAVQQRLEYLLKAWPKAVASMKADPEEAVAYAYQFWAAGMLTIGTGKPQNFFQKVQAFMRRVLGEVRETDKALAIFEAFHDGKLVEPSAAGLAIAKVMATGEWRAKFMKRFDKQVQAVYSEVMTSHDVLRTSESAALRELSTTWWANPGDPDSAGKTGVIDRRMLKTNQYGSRLHAVLDTLSGENQDRDLKALVGRMNGDKAEVSPEVAKAAVALHALLDHFYRYAKSAGVKMGERDMGKYWPVIWDLEKMVESKDAFVTMMVDKYPMQLRSALATIQKVTPSVTTIEEVAQAMHQAIVDRGGVDEGALAAHREDGILNPYFASQNTRNFDWIKATDRQPFLSEDLVATATRYLDQGVRSAEYVRAFGEGGQQLRDTMARKDDVQMMTAAGPVRYAEDGPVVKELKVAAGKLKLQGQAADEWVARRMEDAQRSMGAMEGVLGKDISAGARKFQSVAMVYQGLRVLTLSIFSAMLDPNGIKVAGGTTQNMLDAYVHGLKNVVGTWKDLLTGAKLNTRGDNQDLLNAETVGAIATTMFLEGMGAAHTSEYTAGAARKINRGLFLANGLTAWDRSMRIMAAKAAMQSIASNERNASPEHSTRWLKDLGLRQGDVTLDRDGKLLIDKHLIAAHKGIVWKEATEAQRGEIEAEAQKVHTAINRWVNRAIVSPNAAQRPSRASDPHYAMFYQLKQFTYSFQKTTMLYALNEAEAGNMAAVGQLGMGVPIMIAADVAKAMLTGGGSLPGYMANWTMANWVAHSWNRAGLSGIGQFGIDALHDPLGTLGGPTVSQAVDAVTHPLGETALKAVPVLNKLGGLAQAMKDIE